jgi:hypothetical protein
MLSFSDLAEVSAECLQTGHANLFIPFAERANFDNLRWMLWKPTLATALGAHLLHTEDEVYQYCVTHDWYFPDHFYQDQVLFAMRSVEETEFFESLKHFWSSWVRSNPCP